MGVFGGRTVLYCNRARDSVWSISETLVEKVVESGWLATYNGWRSEKKTGDDIFSRIQTGVVSKGLSTFIYISKDKMTKQENKIL